MTTGVAGLDTVLDGGLEQGAVVVVAGGPGTGKTILAQQMCFAVATAEHKAVFYTTVSEPHTKLVSHLEPFTFFDPGALGARVEHIHLGDFLRPARAEGLQPMVSEIVRKTLDEEPAIVVIDSAKMLRDFAAERELRGALHDLTGLFAQSGAVLLLLGEYAPDELGSSTEFSLADGIIQLDYPVREPVDRRTLRIAKMRGGRHMPGRHTFQIGPAGIQIFPRIETLIPASVTKTTLGMRWITKGLEDGEPSLYVTFQDTPDHLIGMAAAFGWDITAAVDSGQLAISHVPMGELDLDILADTIRINLAQRPLRRVVIDSLAELVLAAREWDRFPAYMRSLVGLVRAAGSSLLATSETIASEITAQSLEGLMFMFDNVIDLRYIEQHVGLGRVLNVVKMRNGPHQMTLNKLTITDHGLEVGESLEGVTGRLGWGALRSQEPLDPRRPAVPAPAKPARMPARRGGASSARGPAPSRSPEPTPSPATSQPGDQPTSQPGDQPGPGR